MLCRARVTEATQDPHVIPFTFRAILSIEFSSMRELRACIVDHLASNARHDRVVSGAGSIQNPAMVARSSSVRATHQATSGSGTSEAQRKADAENRCQTHFLGVVLVGRAGEF